MPDELSGELPPLQPSETRARSGRGRRVAPGLLCGRVHAWVDTLAVLVHTAPEQHGQLSADAQWPQREVIHDHTDADKDERDIL
jgi:hypothetical protein